MTTHDRPPTTCTGCGVEVHWLEVFPANRCLDCHARAHENDTPQQLLEQITKGFGR